MTDFDEWFNELVGFSFRSEWFYDDFSDFDSKNRDRVLKWIEASFEAGRMSNGTTKEN